MARGDVQSSMYNSLSTNANLDARPADGDEWILTMTFSTGGLAYKGIDGDSNITDGWSTGLWGGVTAYSDNAYRPTQHPLKIIITYDEYLRFHNNDGGTQQIGYSAIETKG